jgi:hypothetical protein
MMIEQTMILITALTSLALISSNRIIPGCTFALIGIPFWIFGTDTGQWGIRIAVCVNALVYLIALALHLRTIYLRKQLFEAENEDYEHLSDAV